MIPINFFSRREAAEIIAAAKFSGIPDRPVVTAVREEGVDATDGSATDEAVVELWKAVDKGVLDAVAHGPGDRFLRMSPLETNQVPLLRSARGGDFTFLRPGDSIHAKFVSHFGPALGLVSLIFPQDQVEKLARLNLRRRRRSNSPSGPKLGRPIVLVATGNLVRQIVDDEQWNPKMSLKALTNLVNRSSDTPMGRVSEDTITRALDRIFEETKDRRFQRRHRKSVKLKPRPDS